MPDDGKNPYIYLAHYHFLLPLVCASQTDRVETDREHGEPDLSYVLAAAGPRAAACGRSACLRVGVSACALISDVVAPTVGAARAAPP